MIGQVKNKQEIAEGTLLVEFDLLGETVPFKPGQYFIVQLINPSYPDERHNRRHFSIVNSPNQNNTLAFATRLRDSGFKKSIQEMPIGTKVEIGSIGGHFVLPDDTEKSLVFIAGGIGITPFISMLRFVQEQHLTHHITLVYSNRNQQSTAFLDELQGFDKQNSHFKLLLTMTDDTNWTGEKRRIDMQFIKDHLDDLTKYTYMIAGPPPMVATIEQTLHDLGVSEDSIIKENFSGY